MEAIETIKELATNEEFVTYYDLEEKHKWELENVKMGAYEEAYIEIAKNMLKKGIEPSLISEMTHLAIEEIKKLEKELKIKKFKTIKK